MNTIINSSFGVLFLASFGSLIADAHVFFPDYQEWIAGVGIFIGLTLSILGFVLFLQNK